MSTSVGTGVLLCCWSDIEWRGRCVAKTNMYGDI